MERSQRKPIGWYLAWLLAAPFAVFGIWHAFAVGLGFDSHAYWAATQHMDRLYQAPPLSRDAYLYSPLFAQVLWPLGRLPWPVFGVVWSLIAAALFAWLLRPLPARWFVPAFVATVPEVVTGNVYALMATMLVLGASSGPPWVFLGLTKVTTGALGVLWLSLRRQWRALVSGVATAVTLIAVSVVVAPSQWRAWLEFLLHGSTPNENSISSPLLTGILWTLGVAAVVVAALTDRWWLLGAAAIFVSPTIGFNTLTLLACAPRLSRRARLAGHRSEDRQSPRDGTRLAQP